MILVEIRWPINPFRGDRFAEAWAPAAEAALDYGATRWELRRVLDGRLDFVQTAVFPTKHDFERYWYSEEIAEKRLEVSGYHPVPLLPTFWEIVDTGSAHELGPSSAPAEPS
jgi:hypothetical protein